MGYHVYRNIPSKRYLSRIFKYRAVFNTVFGVLLEAMHMIVPVEGSDVNHILDMGRVRT